MTARRVILILGLFLLATCTGCFEKKPTISGYHWTGGTLYDASGIEIASVIIFPFNVESAQACIFSVNGMEDIGGCKSFETGQEAYDYVAAKFSEHHK